MKVTDISESIKKYQLDQKYPAWAIFWDYKNEIENKGQSILSNENIERTSMHLMLYLFCFGMGRASTKLSFSNIVTFKEIVHNSKNEILNLDETFFERLAETDRQKVTSAFERLGNELRSHNISGSKIMVTKILMALWGQTPAYDRYFVSAYRKLLPRKLGYYAEPDGYFNSLLVLKQESDEWWKHPALANMDEKWTKTSKGTPIPRARLIDMAFWELG